MFSSKDLFFTPAASTGYTVSKSLRFRSSASAYLSKATFATPTDNKKWTWSAWVKIGTINPWAGLFYGGGIGTSQPLTELYLYTDGTLYYQTYNGSVNTGLLQTTQVFRDPSAWYHIVLVIDIANATANNRQRIYVNGAEVTAFSSRTNHGTSDATYFNNASYAGYIGESFPVSGTAAKYFDGYMAEVNFIDGQALTPSSFGAYDTNGIWQPAAYTGTYGTNGFYLKFTTVGATSGSNTGYGQDFSGNGNYWTTNNFGTTSTSSTYDSMLDSPTNATGDIGNYCVISPINSYSSITISNANLTATLTEAAYRKSVSTMAFPTSGKYYVEIDITGINYASYGIVTPDAPLTDRVGGTATGYGATTSAASWDRSNNGTLTGNFWASVNPPANPTLQIAIDTTNGYLWLGYNNTWLDASGGKTGNPASGTNASFTIDTTRIYLPAIGGYKSDSIVMNFNAGQRGFVYTPPSGYSALNTQNLTTPTITNGASYMAAVTYAGSNSSQTITASSTNSGNNPIPTTFQPDFVWIKSRNTADDHSLTDSVRGTASNLASNLTAAENTSTRVSSFNSNGITLAGGFGTTNAAGQNYVVWEWNAGGSTVTNTSGTISAQVRANTSAGFSIVTAQSASTTGSASVGHGLGVTPSMVIFKNRDIADDWYTWHVGLGSSVSGNYIRLNTTAAATSSANIWGGTGYGMTSTTLGLNQSAFFSASNQKFVFYAFAAVASYSAFGSYTGNGSSDGPFVYLGFLPRWLLVKRTDAAGYDWFLVDTSRATYNQIGPGLSPNTSGAEFTLGSPTGGALDILSNGFKRRGSAADLNASGGTYIYAAFAENPFKISRAR